jgi:hypothetical protein
LNGKKGITPCIQGDKAHRIYVDKSKFNTGIESHLFIIRNMDLFGFGGHGGVTKSLEMLQLWTPLWPSISGPSSSSAAPRQLLGTAAFCEPAAAGTDHFYPTWDSYNGQSLLWGYFYPNWHFLELYCSPRTFLPKLLSFLLSFMMSDLSDIALIIIVHLYHSQRGAQLLYF